MSEGAVLEETGESGWHFGILDGVMLAALMVIVIVLIIRFRKKRFEERNSLRKLSVISKYVQWPLFGMQFYDSSLHNLDDVLNSHLFLCSVSV